METYYLYQPTTEITTGPHTISQIQSMWTNGAITTETLIASATAPDEWSHAHYLIEARPEPSPQPTTYGYPKAHANGCGSMVALAIGILVACGLIYIGLAALSPIAIIIAVISACYVERSKYHCSQCGTPIQKTIRKCPSCTIPILSQKSHKAWKKNKTGSISKRRKSRKTIKTKKPPP